MERRLVVIEKESARNETFHGRYRCLALFVAMHPEEAAGGRFCRYVNKSKSELSRDLDGRLQSRNMPPDIAFTCENGCVTLRAKGDRI